jgi:hypothetical protein
MNKLGVAVVFGCAYIASIAAAVHLHADYLFRDAVVGIEVVVVIYAIFLAPTAVVGLVCILFARFTSGTRFRLAAFFALLVGLGVYLLLAVSQSERFGPTILKYDVTAFATQNLVLIALFITVTAAVRRRIE